MKSEGSSAKDHRLTILGLVIGIFALMPAIWFLFSTKTIPEFFRGEPKSPIQIEYIGKYAGGSSLTLRPSMLPQDDNSLSKMESISFPKNNRLIISLKNVTDDTIILNNEMPIKLIDYQPYPYDVDVLFLGGGGGFAFRNFLVSIPPMKEQGLIKATFDEVPGTAQDLSDIRDEEIIDFFTLVPNEVEVFSLEIQFQGSGIYTFQPGIEYFHKGDVIQIWTEDIVAAILPQSITVWDLKESIEAGVYVLKGKCRFAYDNANPEYANGFLFTSVYDCDF